MKKVARTRRRTVHRNSSQDELRSRPPLARMTAIHDAIRSLQFPNSRTLALRLEVDPRTIQRDIEFMRDRMRLPIVYDGARFGFFYDGPAEFFKSSELNLTEGELLALAFAKEALHAHHGTPYSRALSDAFQKLAATLSAERRFSPADLAGLFSFRTVGRALIDPGLFAPLARAALSHVAVTFTYRKPAEGESERRHAQPYHLASINGQWYLAAYDLEREDMRTFALTRMVRLEVTTREFRRDPGFSPEAYFGESLGPFRGEEKGTARIHFEPYAADLIRERAWHPSQVMIEKEGGCIELLLKVSDRYELLRWVLGWGDEARLLSPDSLVSELRSMLRSLQRTYRA